MNSAADAVWAHLECVGATSIPAGKQILVVDAATGKTIANVARVDINRSRAIFIFQPVSGPGRISNLLSSLCRRRSSNYPKVTYPPPTSDTYLGWLRDHHAQTPQEAIAHRSQFATADLVAFQSVDDFDRFTSMESIATKTEVTKLLAQHPRSTYFVFPEDRHNSIRMTGDLPEAWVSRDLEAPLAGTVDPGRSSTPFNSVSGQRALPYLICR